MKKKKQKEFSSKYYFLEKTFGEYFQNMTRGNILRFLQI